MSKERSGAREAEPKVDSLIFLGTGTSAQVPAIGCLTNPNSRCKVCHSSLHSETRKNRRRNTSAIITLSNGRNIMIDCGKSFFEMAVQIWPRAKLRNIDALLLTHAHADAMLGLDDLRGWTFYSFIQPSIPIYCTATTYEAVKEMFPYLVDSEKATGGGDIPDIEWNIISDEEPFWVESCGITIDPLRVEHGRYFDVDRTPFICLGFKLDNISYVSDASAVPSRTKRKIEGSRVLILDALKEGPHSSHFSIPESLTFVNTCNNPPERTYLLDFTHDVDHYELEERLRRTEKLYITPAYDGQQLIFVENEIQEVDLLTEVPLRAVSEQVHKSVSSDTQPKANNTGMIMKQLEWISRYFY